jgi:formylglycine-generating enzyme required for sulfatase activity
VPQLIAGGGGHIEGGLYDWITFYNTTASGGMIERDAVGNPISPVLPDGSLVTAVFLYDVLTFEVVAGNNCPPADLTGDCFVDFNDFALMAAQWLTGTGYIPDDMTLIPGGTFAMGDNFSEGGSDERPVHTVTVDLFFMGKYEITNRQYCDYLNSALSQGLITVTSGVVYKAGSGTSYPYCDTHSSSGYSQIDYNDVTETFSVRTKGGRSMVNDPMVAVTWYGAAAYCNWRGQQESKEQCYNPSTWNCDFSKKGYRLASEAEWEYAARGGLSGRRFPWGDTISHSQANYYGSSSYFYDVSPTRSYHPTWNDGVYPYTSPGGSFAANGYGLYDMAGNVWEWCNDWYGSDYYDYSPTTNPTGPITGSFLRVLRGGSWRSNASTCRVARRGVNAPGDWINYVGFRCVLDF